MINETQRDEYAAILLLVSFSLCLSLSLLVCPRFGLNNFDIFRQRCLRCSSSSRAAEATAAVAEAEAAATAAEDIHKYWENTG